MTDWVSLLTHTRAAHRVLVELYGYLTTLVHVLFLPKLFASRIRTQLRRDDRRTYTSPVAFFFANVLLALGAAHLVSGQGQGALLAVLPMGLLGALLGNVLLLSLIGLTFGLRRRREDELTLRALLYGSAYYIPMSAVLSTLMPGPSTWTTSMGALIWRASPSLLLSSSLVDKASRVGVLTVLSAMWLLLLARVMRAVGPRSMRIRPAFLRLLAVLALVVVGEAGVEYFTFGRTYREMLRVQSAIGEFMEAGTPDVDRMGSYKAAETLMRNIAGCPEFPANERYLAQAMASTLAVMRCEAADELSLGLGETQTRQIAGRTRQLWNSIPEPARFETVLADTADDCGRATSLVTDLQPTARQLRGDIERLYELRSSPGLTLGGGDSWSWSYVSGITFHAMLVPTGLYVCPVPQGRGWPPQRAHLMGVAHDLPTQGRSVAYCVPVSEDPTKRVLLGR